MLELLSFIMLIVRQLFYILGVLAFGKYLLKSESIDNQCTSEVFPMQR